MFRNFFILKYNFYIHLRNKNNSVFYYYSYDIIKGCLVDYDYGAICSISDIIKQIPLSE